jgi:carboxymethylenebutenolidase
MGNTQIDTQAGPVEAVLETPEGDGPWPGVVVIHDAIGFGRDVADNTRAIAEHGYLAVAPNLFSRGKVRCVPSMIRSLLLGKDSSAVADILAARDLLRSRPDCTGKVAVVGFCAGGGFALLVSPMGFDASAPFYPALYGRYRTLLEGACPVVASYGALDPILPGAGRRLEAALADLGVPHDVKTYPGANHSFANVTPAEPLLKVAGLGYNAEAAADAWTRIYAFFDTHLR